MIRRFIIEVILFAFPFIVYFGARALARALKPGIALPDYAQRMPHLTIAGALLAVAGFVTTWALEPRHVDQTYVPSHMENGELKQGGFVDSAPSEEPVLTPMQEAAKARDGDQTKDKAAP